MTATEIPPQGHRRGAARARGVPAALAFVALLALGAAGCGGDRDSIHASGVIEMDEIDVASLVGGRIARLTVDEGDSVRAGDTLVVLDRDEIGAELQAQIAQAGRAQALLHDVVKGPRAEEIRAARAGLDAANAQVALASVEFQRAETLFQQNAIAQAELDRARAAHSDAIARQHSAEENLRLVTLGSREDQRVAAREASSAARASVVAARSRLRELVLTAPASGVVLLRSFEPGEIAGAGQAILSLGDPDRLWMRVYVAAPDLGRIQLGAPVQVHLTGFGDRVFPGKVTEIATRAEFTPRAALTEEERANIVFAVRIALEPSGRVLKPGLPADARIAAAR